jgi:hypothetical protein
MGIDNNVKITAEEDVGFNDKIKAGARDNSKTIGDLDKDMYTGYKAEKNKRKSS